IRRLVLSALAGKAVQSFETFAPEILAKSDLAEQARIQLITWRDMAAPPNTFEERGLVMTIATPLRTSSGTLVGAVIAGRLLNKDLSIVSDIRNWREDWPSIFLGDVRIATTATIQTGENKGKNATGSLLAPERDGVLSRGDLSHFHDDRKMGLYEPLKNGEN